jgi:peptide/nickel transport system ATP-binding protein
MNRFPRDIPAPASAVLRIRDLRVDFRTGGAWQPAVRGLNLDVGANETVAILRESGSGKSVTALGDHRRAISAVGRAGRAAAIP